MSDISGIGVGPTALSANVARPLPIVVSPTAAPTNQGGATARGPILDPIETGVSATARGPIVDPLATAPSATAGGPIRDPLAIEHPATATAKQSNAQVAPNAVSPLVARRGPIADPLPIVQSADTLATADEFGIRTRLSNVNATAISDIAAAFAAQSQVRDDDAI